MLQIKGNYASAVIYSQTAEDYALAQVKMICDQPAAAIIDCLIHHGHLLLFEGKSYRMEHALMRRDA